MLQAIILASGRGTRFSPITDHLPKPLLPLANRPLLDYLLTAVSDAGCSEALVTVGYAGQQIEEYLASTNMPVRIIPVPAPQWEHGPLASLQSALSLLDKGTPCVLLPGDLYISSENLQHLIAASHEVALLFDPHAHRSGTLLQMNAANRIAILTQSPAYLPDYYLGLPALRATRHFFEQSLTMPTHSPSTVFHLLQSWLARNHILQGVPITDPLWCDIDTPADLLALNQALLTKGWPPTPLPPGTYFPEGTSLSGPFRSATLTLGKNAQIVGPALLGDGVEIGDNSVVSNGTSLGALTLVGTYTSLSRCLSLPHAHITSNADLTSAIIDTKGNALH